MAPPCATQQGLAIYRTRTYSCSHRVSADSSECGAASSATRIGESAAIHTYLQMTFTMQPRRLRRRQRTANVSIDQTPVPVYTKRGNPKGEGTGEATDDRPVKEMDAGWCVKGDEWIWGFAANFAVSTANTVGERADYPITIRGFSLSVPTQEVGGEAVKLAKQLVDARNVPGRITFDKGYQGIELHKGLRTLG